MWRTPGRLLGIAFLFLPIMEERVDKQRNNNNNSEQVNKPGPMKVTSRSFTSRVSLLLPIETERSSALRVSRGWSSPLINSKSSRNLSRRYVSATSSVRQAASASATSAASTKTTDMFCFQCEQTRDNKGCTTVGVCGKTPEVAALQDLLMHATKGVSMYANRARQVGGRMYSDPDVDGFVLRSLFSTVTNVNFDESRFREFLDEANRMKAKAKEVYEK